MISIIGNHTVGIGVGIREIGTYFLSTTTYRYRVVVSRTGLEKVGNIVFCIITQLSSTVIELLGCHFRNLFTPTFSSKSTGCQIYICTIYILYLRKYQRIFKSHIRIDTYRYTTLFTFLGRNHKHAVSRSTTVKSSRISTLQNVDALDIVGINQGKSIPTLRRTRISEALATSPRRSRSTDLVCHRYTVNNDQGAVVTHNRLVTTQQDF